MARSMRGPAHNCCCSCCSRSAGRRTGDGGGCRQGHLRRAQAAHYGPLQGRRPHRRREQAKLRSEAGLAGRRPEGCRRRAGRGPLGCGEGGHRSRPRGQSPGGRTNWGRPGEDRSGSASYPECAIDRWGSSRSRCKGRRGYRYQRCVVGPDGTTGHPLAGAAASEGSAAAPLVHLSGNTVGRDLNVTLGNPSVYETMGRDAYLARALEDSDSRIERRRAGAGLDEAQVARIQHLLPQVPHQLRGLSSGQFIVLTGALGTGKSDRAEGWIRSAAELAQSDPDAPLPVWVAIDDLESSLEVHLQREVGVLALETVGADIVIDGLDQRADRAERTIGYADSLTRRWPRSRVVLTSRATHNVRDSVVIRVDPMPKSYGRKLVSLVAGTAQVGDLRPEIEEALERPLFALLIGQQASSGELTTMTEVIEGVVRKVVGREDKDLYPHLRQLAIRTTTTARPVDPESFVDFDVASKLRDSPFLTTTAHGLSFSLATFEQWFASRAVLEEAVSLDDILVDLPSFDRWKYVLSIVLASGEPSRVDPVMARIARWNPGAIGWIINETESAGLNRYREDSSDSQQQMGYRLRFALEAMLDGLGPLSAAFTPFATTGLDSLEHFSLGLEYGGERVSTTWLISNQVPDNPLPPLIDASVEVSTNRWFSIETAAMPASRNWVWAAARNILAGDLSECLTSVAIRIASQHDGVVRREVEDLRRRNVTDPTDLDDIGRGLYGSIYPLPDVMPGRNGWPGFSLE
ncbi:hypothetical protein L841_0420, partial [Mycobacterium sp. MAC_080597_8934]